MSIFQAKPNGDLDLSIPENDPNMPKDKPTSKRYEIKEIIDIFKIVNEHYRNDINAVWLRSNYFMLSDLGLLAFFYSTAFDRGNKSAVIFISMMGILLSLSWIFAIIITIRWIDVWRRTVVDLETSIFKKGPFKRGESIDGNNWHEKVRPEIFPIMLGTIFVLFWFYIFILKIVY